MLPDFQGALPIALRRAIPRGVGPVHRRRWQGRERSRTFEVGVVSAYAVAGTLSAGIAVALGRDPLTTTSWVGLESSAAVGWSVAMGLALGGATVLATRAVVRTASWARTLHEALRPAVRGADGVTLACMALASGVGEEIFFRGLLVPLLGVVASSVAFGLLHQVRGPARWVWAAWASAMGALFAVVFCVTGSIAGSIVAHVLINGANLRFLRDVDLGGAPVTSPQPTRRPLRGLLDRRA
jgi:membrane protease YdiL (CAAX protease family)